MNQMTPTVFIVDDDQAVRDSVQWLVEGAKLKAQAFPSAEAFLEAYNPAAPGCLLLDVRMPGMSGLELQDKLADLNVSIPVIIITGHADVQMSIFAFKHGAMDFLQKPLNRQSVLDCVHRAFEADAKARTRADKAREVDARLSLLTPREREVMDLIMAGRLNKQIAGELGLSSRTVEKHRAQIMAKMQANTVADLVLMTIKATSVAAH